MRRIIHLLLLALAGTVSGWAASAGTSCGPRDMVAERLSQHYDEGVAGRGIAGTAMAELWVSEAGTWTVVVSLPDGRACIIASGVAWVVMPQAAKGEPT